jgi:hypothetical protein
VSAAPPVDLVVNSYERTYRDVLAPGFFPELVEQNRFPFAGRVALVNNVEDRAGARRRAEELLDAGEITAFHFVDHELPAALRVTGLEPADLEPIPHLIGYLLVAVTLAGAPWLVHWDAEVRLAEPVDWIGPALALMEADPRVLAANAGNRHHPAGGREEVEVRGGFSLGHGFSDQLFLARRADLARPIYRRRCVATLRYPLADLGYHFEMRVDAHMRHNGLLRASHIGSGYMHPPETAGAGYAAPTLPQRLRRARNMALLAYLRRAPRPLVPRCSRDLGGGV